MQRLIKFLTGAFLVAAFCQTSFGYSLGGPIGNGGDNWQVPVIGFGLGGDLNAPKNIGEEYRRNVPVVYYAFDQNFFDYFGPEGATAVSGAYGILNALTNIDNYSQQLTEFPTETRNVNYQAQALGLVDLKSWTLTLMMEQLGLADPVRYTWNLHDRYLPPGGACPQDELYLVVQRNFGVTASSLNQLQYSPYVNNVLYTYYIFEHCTGANPLAITIPYPVDPLAITYSPVASEALNFWGGYYTGLTRDDVAGLRYLYSTNNINWESSAAGSLTVVTNTSVTQLFPASTTTNSGVLVNGISYGTASYGALLAFSSTNNAAAVQAAFPGVQLTQLTNYFATVLVTNTISYYTNFPGGVGPSLVTKKVVSTQIIQYFKYRFDNIYTNVYSTNTTAKVQKITIAPLIGAPAGSPLVTNVENSTVTLDVPNGDFYVLPTNSPCGVDIISTLMTFTNYTTNVITSTVSTNDTTTSTNGTITSGYAYAEIQIVPNLSHIYVIHPVTCAATNPVTGLLRGISRIRYQRADYDSLLGQYWQPITNDYTMTLITNSQSGKVNFRRIVTQPDYLFSAADLTTGPGDVPINFLFTRNLNFDQANILSGLAGPGTISSSTKITFNKAGPVYYNGLNDVIDGSPYFNSTPGGDVTDLFYALYFVWANYDGTTNAPVVFPNGTSIENLQNQVLVQISPATLPAGTKGQPYGVVYFTASGGAFSAPFTWSADNLPGGMTLSSSGVLSGNPTQSGTFDFTLTLTDSLARSVQWIYTLKIN